MTSVLDTFFEAINDNNVALVKHMLNSAMIDINAKNASYFNRTCLHQAIAKGYKDMVYMLVTNYKPDIDIEDDRGHAPIHVAYDHYHTDLVKYLAPMSKYINDVRNVLNDEIVNKYFETISSNNIQKMEEILEINKLDVNTFDKSDYNRTALHIAAAKGHLEMIKILIEKYEANLNIHDDIGELPIHNAADNGHDEIVKYLITKGSHCTEDVQIMLKGF